MGRESVWSSGWHSDWEGGREGGEGRREERRGGEEMGAIISRWQSFSGCLVSSFDLICDIPV